MPPPRTVEPSPAKLVHDCRAELSEGPVWWEDALWWVRITDGIFCRWDPREEKAQSWTFDEPLSAAVPTTTKQWLLALRSGIHRFDPATEDLVLLAASTEPAGHRFNDGKCDPQGRFWIGSMSLRGEPGTAKLHCFDTSLRLRPVIDGVTISNGLAWSSDGARCYYIDSPTRRVDCFDFDPSSGTLDSRRALHQFSPDDGFPDGMAIDELDNLWIALWGGSRVVCLHGHTGEELASVPCPVRQPSSCCFGGPKLDRLYITTAWQGLDTAREHEPAAGSIFCASPGVRGVPPTAFQYPLPS